VKQGLIIDYKKYFKSHYSTFHGGADLYVYFIERALTLLRKGGVFSYIVANKWLLTDYGKPLRLFLLTKKIEEIVDFGALPVFSTATTYPCILRVRNDTPTSSFSVVNVDTLSFSNLLDYVKQSKYQIDSINLDENGWTLSESTTQTLLNKIQSVGTPLIDYVEGTIYRGILTGFNKAFIIDESTKTKLVADDPNSADIIKPFLIGKDIKRYGPPNNKGKYVIFTRRGVKVNKYPAILAHLKQYKKELLPKPPDFIGGSWPGRKQGTYEWYEIQDTTNYYQNFEKKKILWPGISAEVTAFTFDNNAQYGNDNTHMIIKDDLYLLGILNSAITRLFLKSICDKVQGGFYRLKITYISQIPIPKINFSNPADKARHDTMVALVERMLALHRQRADVKTDHEKNLIERQIEATDKQIDALVYDLYGLTGEEIRIVEGAGK